MGKITVTEDCNGIKGLKVIEPTTFGDARGYFMETYNYNDFAAAGIDCQFVQDNQSRSTRGVLRGVLDDGVPVKKGMKSGDVDPRCKPEYCTTISDKALAVGGGVVEAVLYLSAKQQGRR